MGLKSKGKFPQKWDGSLLWTLKSVMPRVTAEAGAPDSGAGSGPGKRVWPGDRGSSVGLYSATTLMP